jgi:nitrogen fixation NifU-like protein
MIEADTSKLYQETILAFNRKPLNYGVIQGKNCNMAEYHNPHCGDTVRLFITFSSTTELIIKEISFHGESCAVTKTSASLMTENLKNKNLNQAKKLISSFYSLVEDSSSDYQITEDELGELKVFNSLSRFPSRKTCALLPWKALEQLTYQNKEK